MVEEKTRTYIQVGKVADFFDKLYNGKQLKALVKFRGLKLQNASPEEMICDCCGDGDDCCGFN